MKRFFIIIGKALLWLVSVLLCIALVAGGILGYQGYRLYQDTVSETSLSDRISKVQSREHYISYDQLPQFYIDAVISVEDHRFYSHGGIDLIAIGRAAWHDLRALSFVEGGSTIPQQVAKNLLFTQEKTLERKFAEVFAAFELEKNYTKEEIFELYINSIYFGSGYYGIYAAAQGYFQKNPCDLTEYECAMLAGLPNAPSVYSPTQDGRLARQRLRQVLERMVTCGKLTQDAASALAQP